MLTLDIIANIINGKTSSSVDLDKKISGFSIDSRTLTPGTVFIALQGEMDHGNRFIDKAIEHGAVAIITDQQPELDGISNAVSYILVDDSLAALVKIAEHQRNAFKGKVCGVTGTVGKTSVKEALSFLIRENGLTAHASEKSYNNHIGVPFTLANLDLNADIAVIEMGTNHPGEILSLTQLVRPHVAIVTTVGPGHIEFFNSVSAIAHEKVSIAATLVDGGIAILPADSEFFPLMNDIVINEYNRNVISFGKSETANVRTVSVDLTNFHTLHINAIVMDTPVSYDVPTSNTAWVNNSLAILAAAHAMGLDTTALASHFSDLPLVNGRGRVYSIQINGKNITLIDDAYNANPLSMKAALETLSTYPGRKIAIIGDMRELGNFAEHYHIETGQLCRDLALDQVLTCGVLMEHAFKKLADHQRLDHVGDYTQVLSILQDAVHEGDVVLLKASNGVKLHKVVAELLSASAKAINS
ncbi:MAG: UDP-N-acetylmuramoyl-tripeptide--D-alanyl-D-alanine ligase [Alphaproteobacteria bacterium]|nr:UDP-N-acetylmuramoyl-tripeptide--D-alanyl-D-alanine ligase [Alphaproteobacteria bacterium]